MTAYSHNKFYIGLTTRAPFAAVLVRCHFTGAIVVGGAWQNQRAIQPVLDELKARLQKEFGQTLSSAGITALIEDSEAGPAMAEHAEQTIPLNWNLLFYPMEAVRQNLESVLRVQGSATAKLQIDDKCPGARELAQALDNKIEGGMYDALALCLWQAKEDESVHNLKEPDVETEFNVFKDW